MQLAHPLVAAGVWDHSDFRKRPLGRMRRTLELTQGLVFGTPAEMRTAVQRITDAHRTIRGRLEEETAPLARGTPYAADDPELMLWVHATLIYSTLTTYETFVRPVPAAEREAFYREVNVLGRRIGIPARIIPPDRRAFEIYLSRMIHGGQVVVSPRSRELARHVMRPRLGLVPPLLYAPFEVFTAGLLPPALRESYGLPWGPGRRRAFRLATRLLPRLVSRTPDVLRLVPAARSARRRWLSPSR